MKIEGLDLDARADQVARGGAAPFTASSSVLFEHVEIVVERAHHGFIFSSSVPGRKPIVLAHRDPFTPRHEISRKDLLLQNLRVEAGRERKQRSCRCRPGPAA